MHDPVIINMIITLLYDATNSKDIRQDDYRTSHFSIVNKISVDKLFAILLICYAEIMLYLHHVKSSHLSLK